VLGGREIAVARAHGEAIGLADDGADGDVYGEVEVADHVAEDGDLSSVLLAEVGAVGRDDVEEAGDDGGDSAKVARARGAVEAESDVSRVDEGGVSGRVDIGGGGREEEMDACGFQLAAVFVEGARVGFVVFAGRELGGVDEDGCGDEVTFCAGGGDEG